MTRTPERSTRKDVDFEETARALAKAMYEGDIVNFRLLFLPFSPARGSSTEAFAMPKYAYLLPDEELEAKPEFQEYLARVLQPDIRAFIEGELDADRPAQLPAELLLTLADNAVRQGRYTSAAQAYELLRIRARMEEEFLKQAEAALDANDIPRAVCGCIIAVGLAYDYGAFPEPLPATPDFQTRALLMHAEYPETPEQAPGMAETPILLRAALDYLLLGSQAAAIAGRKPEAVQTAFLQELVRRRDPQWKDFTVRYEEACGRAAAFAEHARSATGAQELPDEFHRDSDEDPRTISSGLLGWTIEEGEWWQYLKELACLHPAAALFVARQVVGGVEVIVPRHRPACPVARALGLPV